jgi:NADH-quinone oxidoreductase subunit M
MGFCAFCCRCFRRSDAELARPVVGLAVVTIVFSAAAAYAQTDLKRMLAYSSVNHLGYCLLAIFRRGGRLWRRGGGSRRTRWRR